MVIVALIGNCGFWLYCFNRINAVGLSRKATKRIEKAIVLACFAIPALIASWTLRDSLAWLSSDQWLPQSPTTQAWLFASTLAFVVLGLFWLESRRWLIPPRHLLSETGELHHVGKTLDGGSTADRTTQFLESLPGNQITQLTVTRKELELPRDIPNADGLTIGHLSDLHFTGQYRPEHYEYVFERFQELAPDLIVVSGDIIDYDHCLPWIQRLLAPLSAPLGCAFVFGNHEQRLSNHADALRELEQLRWIDVGKENTVLDCSPLGRELTLELVGNEYPWFKRHAQPILPPQPLEPASANSLRLGISHSPDQINWARTLRCDLMLAGHTHGGQARFPFIGPILSPSWYGSKFASGVFYLAPTLMHVSRGTAGTHPLRYWCPPEVSLLTLRSKS